MKIFLLDDEEKVLLELAKIGLKRVERPKRPKIEKPFKPSSQRAYPSFCYEKNADLPSKTCRKSKKELDKP